MNLEGKKSLVTGGGRGIGKGCALQLAARGSDVVLNDRPGSPDVAAAAEEIRALGRICEVVEADVFAREGCELLLNKAVELAGKIDILISNPATGTREAFLEYDPATFEHVIGGVLTAGFQISQLVARHMVERGGGGKIVFISSVHAVMAYGRSVAYNAGKAGLNHMARTIAAELARHRINVNVIEPGWIDTPGEREKFADIMDDAATRLPWGRLGVPADIGKAAAFLASADADYITGTCLTVDGGYLLKDCVPET